MKRFITATIATLALVVSMTASHAFAQTSGDSIGGQGLQLGPPLISMIGDPGEVVKTRVSLRNVTANKLVVSNVINDFVADGEDGSPRILLNDEEESPYSIREWIKPLPNINLVPEQVQSFDIEVTIPKSAAPGGYYGVIRFTGSPPNVEDTGVGLAASVGALVLLKVNGDAKEEMELVQFTTANFSEENADNDLPNWLFESAPFKFIEKYKNTGNIHEQPVGKIIITDIFGNVVTEIKVNDPPRNVLPGSTRKFQQTVTSEDLGDRFMFGMYNAKLESIYGTSVVPLEAKLTFWVLPWRIILVVIGILIALFFIIRFAIRRYVQRTVGRSRGRRR